MIHAESAAAAWQSTFFDIWRWECRTNDDWLDFMCMRARVCLFRKTYSQFFFSFAPSPHQSHPCFAARCAFWCMQHHINRWPSDFFFQTHMLLYSPTIQALRFFGMCRDGKINYFYCCYTAGPKYRCNTTWLRCNATAQWQRKQMNYVINRPFFLFACLLCIFPSLASHLTTTLSHSVNLINIS